MPKACDLKKGSIVSLDGAPCVLEDLTVSTPSARGGATLYRCRFRHLVTKQKIDRTFKGDDMLPPIDFAKREVQFLYEQSGSYAFMDLEDFSQFELGEQELAEEKLYLVEDMEGIYALVVEGRVVGIELPSTVELEIAQCDPSIKGASATARTKPATLTTGLIVQVPEHISQGDVVRVDTRDGRFLGRA